MTENTSPRAALFVLLGQSNAVGHDLPMAEGDKIVTPLSRVYGLNRRENQAFGLRQVTWSHYTSAGMNLAEEQDHTYSVANCLAAQWQKAANEGTDLPDLYIVHIAIGAQGISKKYMWHPEYPKVLQPGPLGTVNMALYPFTMEILTAAQRSLSRIYGSRVCSCVHWVGGENDTGESEEDVAALPGLYRRFFGDVRAILPDAPIVLHRMVCDERMDDLDPSGAAKAHMDRINRLFDDFTAEYPFICVFDPAQAPYYRPNISGRGVFKADKVHFTREMNEWKAACILDSFR